MISPDTLPAPARGALDIRLHRGTRAARGARAGDPEEPRRDPQARGAQPVERGPDRRDRRVPDGARRGSSPDSPSGSSSSRPGGRRVREPRAVGPHPRLRAQPRREERGVEPDLRDGREPAAPRPERGLVPEVPPEAPRVPGGLRAGRGPAEPVGGASRRELRAREGPVAPPLPVLPAHAPAAPARDLAVRRLGVREHRRPGRLRRGRDLPARAEGAPVPRGRVHLLRRASTRSGRAGSRSTTSSTARRRRRRATTGS